jgi:diacylglycerol O-acyltransferase
MERLSGLDAGFLYMETPTLHMHTLKIAFLDRPPGDALPLAELREAIRQRLPLLPPFRRRIVDVPFGFHHPVWIEDPDFDLDYHVRRVMLPAPGTRRQLEEAIADIASVPLDRRRPLWRMDVFDGLEDDRIAVLVKIHHAVADGLASAALLANVMSSSAVDDDLPVDRWRPESVPTAGRLLRDALRDHFAQLRNLPRLLRRTLANLRALVRHRRQSSVSTPMPMLHTPRTSFNGALTPRRSFVTASVAVVDIDTVREAFGVTVNDVVLGVVSGGLRAYLLERGELPGLSLVAGVPVAADVPAADEDVAVRLEGNRVSNLFTSLATDEADPVRRLHRIRDVTNEAKYLQKLMGRETLADWVQYTPPRPWAWFMRQYSGHRIADRHPPAINLVVSNVPGPPTPLYAAGAELRELYSVGPVLEGIGLNITVWSYLDRYYIGLLGCRDEVPEPWRITDAMQRALAELATAAAQIPVVASNT